MGVWFPDYITLPWLSDCCSISFHFACFFFVWLFVLFCFCFSRIFTSGSCARSVLGIQLFRRNCAILFCAPPMSLGSPLLAVVVVCLLIAAALLMSTLYVEVQMYTYFIDGLHSIYGNWRQRVMWCRYWPIIKQHGDVMPFNSHGKMKSVYCLIWAAVLHSYTFRNHSDSLWKLLVS